MYLVHLPPVIFFFAWHWVFHIKWTTRKKCVTNNEKKWDKSWECAPTYSIQKLNVAHWIICYESKLSYQWVVFNHFFKKGNVYSCKNALWERVNNRSALKPFVYLTQRLYHRAKAYVMPCRCNRLKRLAQSNQWHTFKLVRQLSYGIVKSKMIVDHEFNENAIAAHN